MLRILCLLHACARGGESDSATAPWKDGLDAQQESELDEHGLAELDERGLVELVECGPLWLDEDGPSGLNERVETDLNPQEFSSSPGEQHRRATQYYAKEQVSSISA